MTNEVKSVKKVKPLNEIIFKNFLADELTVKEVKSLNVALADRFEYIIEKIAELTNRYVAWFDYDNVSHSDDYSRGFFDTENYKSHVGYVSEFLFENKQKYTYEKYDNVFPTKWFYQNFESVLEAEIEEFFKEEELKEEKKKSNKNKDQEELQKFKESIIKKLTQEELAYISFLSIENVRENKKNTNKLISTEVSKFVKEMKENGVMVSTKYEEYRKGKKKATDFESWVLKNMSKIRDSI